MPGGIALGYEFHATGVVGFQGVLEELGEDLSSAKSYLGTHGDFGFTGEGILNTFSSVHEDALGRVNSQIDHLHEYFTSTLHQHMGEVLGLYHVQEDGAEEKLRELERTFKADSDRLVRDRDSGATTTEPDTGFPRPAEPGDRLTTPSPDADDVYIQPEPNNVLDHFSVQFVARQMIVMFTDHDDPMDWLGKRFAGDWEAFLACADALDNVASCIRDVADNFIAHVDQLEAAWSGNAYDAFNLALRNIRDQIVDGTVVPIEDLAKNYRDAASSTVQDYLAIEPIMGTVVDAIGTMGFGLVKNTFKLKDFIKEAVEPSLDQAVDIAAGSLAAAETKKVDFTEVELVELREIGGSGSGLMLNDDGLPVVVEQYEQL